MTLDGQWIVLASWCLLSMLESSFGQCPNGWTWVQTKCFQCYYVTTSLPDARSHCTSIKGTMASIHTSVEDQWVQNNCGIRVLIGYDSVSKTWEDGSAVNYSKSVFPTLSSDSCVVLKQTNWLKYDCTGIISQYPAYAVCSCYPGTAGPTAGPVTGPVTSPQQATAAFAGTTASTAGPATMSLTPSQQATTTQQMKASVPSTTASTAGPATMSLTPSQQATTTQQMKASVPRTAAPTAGAVTLPLTVPHQAQTANAPGCDVAVATRQKSTHNNAHAMYAIDGLSDTCSTTGHALKNWFKIELLCRATVSRITLQGEGLDHVRVTVADVTDESGYMGGADQPGNRLCAEDHNPVNRGRKVVACYTPLQGTYIYIASVGGKSQSMSVCNLIIN